MLRDYLARLFPSLFKQHSLSFEAAFEGSSEAMFIINQKGFIIAVNSQTEKIFDYTKQEIIGQTPQLLIPKFNAADDAQEQYGKRKDKSEFPITLKKSKFTISDGELMIIAIQDVSEIKTLEKLVIKKNIQLVNANLAKDQFLSHMSHELRIPLNGIIAMTQLLRASNFPSEYREQLEILTESEEHMLSVVNHILEFSKIESGKINVDNKRFNFYDLINKIRAIYSLKVKDKKINLILNVHEGVPEYFTGDPDKIQQVLSNILDNAVKFTHLGSINFSVSVQKNECNHRSILFDVIDTGVGLNPESISRLFTPYLQEKNTASNFYNGTGLGLAISKNLVDVMGGTIHAEPLAVGSRFYFSVPFIIQEEATITKSESIPKTETVSPVKTISSDILLVEDNVLNQRTLKILLDKFGFTVTIAGDGNHALELMAKSSYNLILMDCQMPNKDGYTSAIEIRKLEQGSDQHIPIIGVTAHAEAGNRQKCLDAGMDDFIAKPFNIEEFHSLLLKYVVR